MYGSLIFKKNQSDTFRVAGIKEVRIENRLNTDNKKAASGGF